MPRLSRLLKVIGTDTDRPTTCDFLLTFHSKWTSRTVSEITANSVENCNFPYPVYLNDLLRGFHLELDNGVWARKTRPIEWWGYLVENKVLRWLTFEYDSECDWRTQTDEHPPAAVSARGSCGLAKKWQFYGEFFEDRWKETIIPENRSYQLLFKITTYQVLSLSRPRKIACSLREQSHSREEQDISRANSKVLFRFAEDSFSDRKVNGKFVEISRALLVFLCYSYMNVN